MSQPADEPADAVDAGLWWPGREQALAAADDAPAVGLEALRGASRQFDDAAHLFVEGDNLDVLRLLAPAYAGAVGLVYLDPPYNTGALQSFGDRRRRGGGWQGRHAQWLSFMAPRLVLARRMLRPAGVLLVSIDDHELAHLRMLLDALFGESRRLGTFVWRRRSGALDARSNLSEDHEYVLAYTRGLGGLAGRPRRFEGYRNPDGDPRGPWIADNLSAAKPGGDTWYAIVDPATGVEYWPPRGRYWPYARATMARKIAEGRVLFPRRRDGSPMLKRFRGEARQQRRPVSSWIDPAAGAEDGGLRAGTTAEGTRALKRLFGDKVFRYAKPVSLLAGLVAQASGPDDFVLDPFAGSGTMAEAVLAANAVDGGRRRFLLVQQSEPLDHGPFDDIATLALERVRRVLERDAPPGPQRGVRVFRVVAPPGGRHLADALAAGRPLHVGGST